MHSVGVTPLFTPAQKIALTACALSLTFFVGVVAYYFVQPSGLPPSRMLIRTLLTVPFSAAVVATPFYLPVMILIRRGPAYVVATLLWMLLVGSATRWGLAHDFDRTRWDGVMIASALSGAILGPLLAAMLVDPIRVRRVGAQLQQEGASKVAGLQAELAESRRSSEALLKKVKDDADERERFAALRNYMRG